MQKTDKIFSFMLDYTNRNLRRYAAERFVEEGLQITLDQWGTLLLLRDSGDGLSNSELADRMSKDKPTVTRIVDVLVRKSLVVRRPSETDRRQSRICLTRKGGTTVEAAEPVVKKIRRDVSASLSKSEKDMLLHCLNRLNDRIERLRG